ENEEKILRVLARRKLAGAVDAVELSEASGLPLATVMSAVVSLESAGLARVERSTREFIELSEEGADYAARGTPERRLRATLARAAPSEGLSLEEASRIAGLSDEERGIALQWLVRDKLAAVEKRGGVTILKPLATAETPTERALARLKGVRLEAKVLPPMDLEILKKRRLARVVEEKTAHVEITAEGVEAVEALERGAAVGVVSRLTPQMLRDGSWKGKRFREYDPQTAAAPLEAVAFGKKHAYVELLRRVKEKLVGMGFREEHGPLVELEFWNMDALFMAQDHPAREIHDVFQVEDPARGEILDEALIARVRKAHEEGLEGSRGWRYEWNPEIALRLVMRSQTTSVSARVLARGIKPPLRVFCIGRVFRPEAIDWKHLMEFNQCEGIVCDESMNFRDLLGYLRDFALDIFGAEEARFAPSYFPFTEPSVELLARMPQGGWMEVGGAGLFRPEMLSALQVDVPVLAWGLGIDRLAMLKLGITDIRDLFSRDIRFLKQKW
ncbi:MAG: phenylalanine--tRNA ligase subunit alpha, partial [Candidatus Norongarragalinales archaeon]